MMWFLLLWGLVWSGVSIFRFQGLGFRVEGLGFRVQGLGFSPNMWLMVRLVKGEGP